jgi:hypothetical protein
MSNYFQVPWIVIRLAPFSTVSGFARIFSISVRCAVAGVSKWTEMTAKFLNPHHLNERCLRFFVFLSPLDVE